MIRRSLIGDSSSSLLRNPLKDTKFFLDCRDTFNYGTQRKINIFSFLPVKGIQLGL